MMTHINAAFANIKTNNKAAFKAALLETLESYVEEKGDVPGIRIDVEDIMRSLESKDLFKSVKMIESEPIEELQEKQENAENITGMRPMAEESDEESVEEESDLVLYRKKRLMEEKSKPDSTEKKRDSHKEKYIIIYLRQHHEKKHSDKKKTKPVAPYQGYPYYPPAYLYYPPAYLSGARFQPLGKDSILNLAAGEGGAIIPGKKVEQVDVPSKAPEVKVEQKPDQKKTLPKKKHAMHPNTILIRHVPAELNTISSIDNYFSKLFACSYLDLVKSLTSLLTLIVRLLLFDSLLLKLPLLPEFLKNQLWVIVILSSCKKVRQKKFH